MALVVAVLLTTAAGLAAVANVPSKPASVTRTLAAGTSAIDPVSILARGGNHNLVITKYGSAGVTPARTVKVPLGAVGLSSRGQKIASAPAGAPVSTPCDRVTEPEPMCPVAMP
jgi:hypothetical protein